MKKAVLLFSITLFISLFTSCSSDDNDSIYTEEEEENGFNKNTTYRNMFGVWIYDWHYLANEYNQTDESKQYDFLDYTCDGRGTSIIGVNITKELVTIKTDRTDFDCKTVTYSFKPTFEKNEYGDIRLLNSNNEYQFTLRYLKESTGHYTSFYFLIDKENSPVIVRDIFFGTQEIIPVESRGAHIRMSKFEAPKK